MREIYYIKPVDNSRLVPLGDPRAPRQQLAVLIVAAAIFVLVLSSAWQRFNGVEDGYRLEVLRFEKQKLAQTNRKLRLEEASLVDPVRIDMIARADLGMTALHPGQIIVSEPTAVAQDSAVLANARPASSRIAYQVNHVAAAVP